MVIPASFDAFPSPPTPPLPADDGKEFFLLKAIKPISKGEAITQLYQPYVIHRPDMALLHYGYVPVRRAGRGETVEWRSCDLCIHAVRCCAVARGQEH